MIREAPVYPTRTAGSCARSPWCSFNTTAGVIICLWGIGIAWDQFSDNSFATHLATGRLIMESGVPGSDPYSFTALGESWTVQSWLPSFIFAVIERFGSSNAIHVLIACLTGALAYLTWSLTRPAESLVARIAVSLPVLIIGSVAWAPRPLLFGLLGMSLFVLAAEEGIDSRWLVPVMWIWVNSHGSFPLGLVFLVLTLAGSWMDRRPVKQELRLILWASVGFVVAAISPLGLRVFLFPLDLLSRADVLRNVTEWQAPSFTVSWQRVFLLVLLGLFVSIRRRPSWRDLLPSAVFVCTALLATRNIAVAMVVLTPVLARGLADLGSLRGDGPQMILRPVNLLLLGVVPAAVVMSSSVGWDLTSYPTDAIAWMDNRGIDGSSTRIASEETTGNYLELIYGTDSQVFMDDRFDMFSEEHFFDYLALERASSSWERVLEEWRVEVVVWRSDSALFRQLSTDDSWRMRYLSEQWVVYCHRSRCPEAMS